MVPNIDPEQVRKLAGWGLTQNDRASFVGWSQSLISLGFSSIYALRRLAIKYSVEQGHWTQSNRLGIKDLWPSASRFWHLIKPGLKRSKTQILTLSDPQNQRSRTQNPKQTRPQPPVARGCADKADSRPPLQGPGGWGGDWYAWHAPDGLRARAATGLGCMQADTEKLGVIEASYASAIIGVVDRPLFRREGTTQPKGLIST